MNQHDHLGVLLTAYADGSLPEEGCAFIEQQLEAHPELRDRLGEIRAAQETLRASLPAAPEALSAERIAAIMAQAERRPVPRASRWRPLIVLAAAGFVVAFVGVLATPNLLESRVSAVAARDAAMRRYQEQGYAAGASSPAAPAPVRVTSIPPPPPRREAFGDGVVLGGMALSDAPAPVTRLEMSEVAASEEENDSPVAKGREEAVSERSLAGRGAFKPAERPAGTDREGLRAAKDGTRSLDMVRQRDGELTHIASAAQGPAAVLQVKRAEVEDDLTVAANRPGQAGEAKRRDGRRDLAGAQADFNALKETWTTRSGGGVAKLEAGRKQADAAQDKDKGKDEVQTRYPKVHEALADSKKAASAPSVMPPKPAATPRPEAGKADEGRMREVGQLDQLADRVQQEAGYGYVVTDDQDGLRRSLQRQNAGNQAQQQDLQQAAIHPTGIGFLPHGQSQVIAMLGERRAVAYERLQKAGGSPLAEQLLELLQLDGQAEPGSPIAVPFRLLVDPNLPIRNRVDAGVHGTPGQAVLNLCTANGLQVVPMPGGFEVQTSRRPLDPTATFGWSRADLRTVFGSAPMQVVAEDAQQTFAIDASTSSFDAAQAALAAGRLPDPSQIEPQHLYNAVPADYPAPTGDDAFQILAEAGPSPFASGPLATRTALVAVGVVSRRAAEGERVPLDLVVALDASGSMGRPAGLARARAGLDALLPHLDARDRVAVVAFGDVARVVQPALRGDQRLRLAEALGSVQPAGATNLADGLALACQVAGEMATPGRTCRVLLATDGAALAGDAAPAAEAAVSRWRGHGVSLLVVGCADEQYDAAALERLAQKGDGEHLVAGSDQQARELFSGRLLPARLAILARDAKAQVTWNPDRVAHARLIGFENRRLSHEQFRDNTVDAGELAQDAQATALFEIVLHDRGSGPLGTAAVRYHDTRLGRVVELARPLPGGLVAATASPRLRLLACAAELGEQMQAGWWRNVRGPSDRLAAELARLDQPFAQVLAGMERRFHDLERQDAKP